MIEMEVFCLPGTEAEDVEKAARFSLQRMMHMEPDYGHNLTYKAKVKVEAEMLTKISSKHEEALAQAHRDRTYRMVDMMEKIADKMNDAGLPQPPEEVLAMMADALLNVIEAAEAKEATLQ